MAMSTLTLTRETQAGAAAVEARPVNTPAAHPIDIDRLRADFPALRRTVNGQPLVYFDNTAATLKPQAVIDALVRFYSDHPANVHRGIHLLSEEATEAYEEARAKLAQFIGAARAEEVIF